MLRWLSAALVALEVLSSVGVNAKTPSSAQAERAPLRIAAPSAVLVDAADRQVLFAQGADTVRAPASMVKIMTLVIALQALRQGKVHARDLVSVSDRAYRTGGSQIWLEPGETLPFRQLLVALAVGSANDAAVAIAEHVAGNVDRFVGKMNALAREIGMTHTQFVNPNGLDAGSEVTRTTASDMAVLAAYASTFPELLRLTSTREDRTLRNGKGGTLWLVNHNRLLGKVWGLDGLKTGFTSAAGYCLAATARREALRLVAVVMGDATSKQRFEDARAMLEWGFEHYRATVAAQSGQTFAVIPVAGGEPPRVSAVASTEVTFTVPASAGRTRPTVDLQLRRLTAPVAAGERVGMAVAHLGTRTKQVPLVAKRAVRRASLGDVARRMMAGLFRNGPTSSQRPSKSAG